MIRRPDRPNRAKPLATLAMALFLSGCLSADQATSTLPPPPRAAADKAETPAPVNAASLTPAATWTLDDLAEATPDMVKGLLGAPAFVRTEPPAAYWRYGDETCALDIYLYAEDAGEARVRHAELRRQGAGDAIGCLDHLRRTLVADRAQQG